jgi:cytochrome c1
MTTMRTALVLPAVFAALAIAGSSAALAQEHDTPQPPALKWSFSGPFGTFDRAQLQRGFKVYKEVCSNCHSLNYLSFRNLSDAGGPGFSEAQVKSLAAEYKVKDGPNDAGDMFERPGRPADKLPAPFANDAAARAANGGGLPPDLSVIAKARTYERGFPRFVFDIFTQYQEQGPDYIASILKGYAQAPADVKMAEGMQYNTYFPGHQIKMPPPLSDGQVTFDDGSPATLAEYAQDVGAFLMWTAEPKLEARKRIGFQVMIFLLVFGGLLYFTKKRVWYPVKHPEMLSDKTASPPHV